MGLDLLAKDLGNGLLLCTVCTSQVKAKVWTAHVNGKGHLENVRQLKAKVLGQRKQQPASSTKRPTSQEDDETMVATKRAKEEEIPKNGSSYEPKSTAGEPSRKLTKVNSSSSSEILPKKEQSSIEGLPAGFFDDDKLNRGVRETAEHEKAMENEMQRFYKEVSEADSRAEVVDEHETEATAFQRDLDLIDDQISRWKTINELELKKESIKKATSSMDTDSPTCINSGQDDGAAAAVDESSDEGEIDDTLLQLDWRTKMF